MLPCARERAVNPVPGAVIVLADTPAAKQEIAGILGDDGIHCSKIPYCRGRCRAIDRRGGVDAGVFVHIDDAECAQAASKGGGDRVRIRIGG